MTSLKRKQDDISSSSSSKSKPDKKSKTQSSQSPPRLVFTNTTQNIALFIKYMEYYGATLIKASSSSSDSSFSSSSPSFLGVSEEFRMIREALQLKDHEDSSSKGLQLVMPVPGTPSEYRPKELFLHTYKCDGKRCVLVMYQDMMYVVLGRGTHQEATHTNLIYPHLPTRNKGAYLILDGELVLVHNPDGEPKHKRYIFVACDLLAVEGYSCIKMPAEERFKTMYMFLHTLNQKQNFVPNSHQTLVQVVPKRYFAHTQLDQLAKLMQRVQPGPEEKEEDRLLYEDYPIYSCVEPMSGKPIKVDGIVSVDRTSPYFCKRHQILKSKASHTSDFAIADLVAQHPSTEPVLSPVTMKRVYTLPWTFFLECGLPTVRPHHFTQQPPITPFSGPVVLPVGWAVRDVSHPIPDTTLPPPSSPHALWSMFDSNLPSPTLSVSSPSSPTIVPVNIALDLWSGKWIIMDDESPQSVVTIETWFREALQELTRLQALAQEANMSHREWVCAHKPKTRAWTFAVRQKDWKEGKDGGDSKNKKNTSFLFGYQHTNPYVWKSQASHRVPLERDDSVFQKRHKFHPRGAREKSEQTQLLSEYAGSLHTLYPSSARAIVSMGTLPYDAKNALRDTLQMHLSTSKTEVIYECGWNTRTKNWDLLKKRDDKRHPNFHVTFFDGLRCILMDWTSECVLKEGK